MRRLIVLILLIAGASLWPSPAPAQELLIDDFSASQEGAFPLGWQVVGPFRNSYYLVRRDPAPYLEARAQKAARGIGRRVDFSVRDYPCLTWEWRVLTLPRGGDERIRAKGDSAAGVFVVLSGRPMPRTIRYVWSASLPVGTVADSPHKPHNKIVVLRNQDSPLNAWLAEKVNIAADCRRLFPDDPGQVRAVVIQSDADNTGSLAVAHYRRLAAGKD